MTFQVGDIKLPFMRQAVLQRFWATKEATYGALMIDEVPFCLTLEPPWKDNQHEISCIPAGVYYCSPHESEKHGSCYAINDVPDRTDILFHIGNFPSETHGCVLIAEKFSRERGGIGRSSWAMEDLLQHIGPNPFSLIVRG